VIPATERGETRANQDKKKQIDMLNICWSDRKVYWGIKRKEQRKKKGQRKIK
jgi:hypothetical protein